MINCFLLFHKCGNNYVMNVHCADPETHFIESVEPHEADNIIRYDKYGTVVNIRCRNFDDETIKTSGLLKIKSAKFALFTRNPASFILSATQYHLRGSEEWAIKQPQKLLLGKTLTQALREATSLDERQIITMKQFDWLYQKQVSLLKYLKDPRFWRIRCEDIFTTTDETYFSDLADFLRCSDKPSFLNALKVASPSFNKELPPHSTGAFKIENAYNVLGKEARDYYDLHWMKYARALSYDCWDK